MGRMDLATALRRHVHRNRSKLSQRIPIEKLIFIIVRFPFLFSFSLYIKKKEEENNIEMTLIQIVFVCLLQRRFHLYLLIDFVDRLQLSLFCLVRLFLLLSPPHLPSFLSPPPPHHKYQQSPILIK